MDIAARGTGSVYAIDRGASCTKPPRAAEPGHHIVHSFHQNKGGRSQVYPPVVGQFMLFHAFQSNLVWIPLGVPQHQQKLVLKYFNPSPASAKGHMKRPHHGIHGMTPKTTAAPPLGVINNAPIVLVPPPLLVASNNTGGDWIEPFLDHRPGVSKIIDNDGYGSIANIFAFGVFAK
jgi:hypothetical protein